jgi:hypothetical protein
MKTHAACACLLAVVLPLSLSAHARDPASGASAAASVPRYSSFARPLRAPEAPPALRLRGSLIPGTEQGGHGTGSRWRSGAATIQGVDAQGRPFIVTRRPGSGRLVRPARGGARRPR